MSTPSEFSALPQDEHRNELTVVVDKMFRRAIDLTPEEREMLSFIVTSPSCHFGNPRDINTVEDCFDGRNVDDGIVFYKKLTMIMIDTRQQPAAADDDATASFHYWFGYFGGNPTGYILLKGGGSGGGCSQQWDVIIENCDTDFVWRGPGSAQRHFIKVVKKAVYGKKYHEGEDEE